VRFVSHVKQGKEQDLTQVLFEISYPLKQVEQVTFEEQTEHPTGQRMQRDPEAE